MPKLQLAHDVHDVIFMPALLKVFADCTDRTGIPLQELVNEALKNFIHDEIPVKNEFIQRDHPSRGGGG